MKTLLIYFSQTGYTRKAAERIRDGAEEMGADCELIAIKDVDINALKDYDLVGLGCPVFYYQAPVNVKKFVESLPNLRGKRWFVFCSHGCMRGIALESMADGLKRKGVEVIGYYDIYADATAPFIPFPTYTTGHPDEKDYAEALSFGKEIISRARLIEAGEQCKIPVPKPVELNWRLSAELFTPLVMDTYLPKIEVDLLKCTLCHTCEKNCPVSGIDIEAYPPRLQDPCIYCYRCVMVCPETALNAKDSDWKMLYDELPASYAKFRKKLKREVNKGKFRWQMNPDSVDFVDTQLKQRKRKLGK